MTEVLSPEIDSRDTAELGTHNNVACVFTTSFPASIDAGLSYLADNGRRQELALKNLLDLRKQGYQIVVIDFKSSDDFLNKLREAGIEVKAQKRKGLSAGKQEGYEIASSLPGVEAIVTAEAEKHISFDQLTRPILANEADIVFPHRGSLEGYPLAQIEYENRISSDITHFLRTRGLIGPEAIFDFPNGTRVFRNRPDILALFSHSYKFTVPIDITVKKKYDQADIEHEVKQLDPGIYYDALMAPLIEAYYHNKIHPENPYRILSVPIEYMHDLQQTASEEGNEYFERKRRWQYYETVIAAGHHLRLLDEENRLVAPAKRSNLRRLS